MKRPTKKDAPDHAAIIADIDTNIVRRTQQLEDARGSVAKAHAELKAAYQRRDQHRMKALADRDEAARGEYLRSVSDVRSLEDIKSEAEQLIIQIEGDLIRLQADRVAAVQAEARAKVDDIARERCLSFARKCDALIDELAKTLAEWKSANVDSAQIAADADLPEIAGNRKRLSLDHVGWVLRDRLGAYGVGGIRLHVFDGARLVDLEAERKGLAPPTDRLAQREQRQQPAQTSTVDMGIAEPEVTAA
jgi:hypothetical protein